jgi:murein DD-endopeptidase MepM/ murein hydrolase activator NlpD
MRVRLQIKLPPGLRPNSSVKRGGVVSTGARGLSTNIDERGRRYTIVEVPGTGLSWRELEQQYFVLVLAHLLHGRLRRIQIRPQFVYVGFALALISFFFLLGFVFSYARMTWKVANYNSLQREAENIRTRYQNLQKIVEQTNEQPVSLGLLTNEVSVGYGIKQKLKGPSDMAARDKFLPMFSETVAQGNYLRGPNLSRFEFARHGHVHTRPGIWPVDGRLMSSFGQRTDPFSGEGAYHAGVDISARLGASAVATADGIVVFAGRDGGYGRLVVVDHGNDYETYYAHLSRFDVIAGQQIRQGEPVGEIGASGRVTAPHLHYEIRVRHTPVNPFQYLVSKAPEQ